MPLDEHKLGEQSRSTSALQEQPNWQCTTLAIAVQYSTRHYKHWVLCVSVEQARDILVTTN